MKYLIKLTAISCIALTSASVSAGSSISEETKNIIVTSLDCTNGQSIDLLSGITRNGTETSSSSDTKFLRSLKKEGIKTKPYTDGESTAGTIFTLDSPVQSLGYEIKKFSIGETEGNTELSYVIPNTITQELKKRLKNPAITDQYKTKRTISIEKIKQGYKVSCTY